MLTAGDYIKQKLRSIAFFGIIFFLTASTVCKAQSKIVGVVVDQNDKAVSNANVLLLRSADSSMVKGMVSTSSGKYQFENVRAGSYLIQSTFTGLQHAFTSSFNIDGAQKEIDLGRLVMKEDARQLNVVTVTSRRPLYEQKIDRLIVNVENSITAAGNTALDVLERSPGVIVDHQNNVISMNGKDGVVIMMNGKISHMPMEAAVQMLAGMSSSNIDKIELITTPPANFDAEGNAGYINIVLKNNENFGTNGSYSATVGYGQGLVASANLALNHRRGKVNLFGDVSLSQTKTTPYISFYREISNENIVSKIFNNTDRNATVTNYNGRVGIDYQWNNRTIVGGLLTFYSNRFSMDALNSSTVTKGDHLDTSISIINYETNQWKNYSGNINLQHNFKQDEKLTVNLDYIYYSNDQPVQYFNSYYDGSGNFLFEEDTRSGKLTPIDLWVSAIDYSKSIGKKVSLEAGLKGTKSAFTNDISYEKRQEDGWVKDSTGNAKYKLDEKYGAAYASFNVTVNAKTSIKAGLRYEYTTSNLGTLEVKNIVDRRYGNLFPSFFISHKINDNTSLNFSYNRRITRPTFNALAPFTYYGSPNSLITGNPSLQPAISNMVKADYVFRKYLFSISYTKEDHTITNFQPHTDSVTNRLILSPENLVNSKIISFVVTVPVDVTNWWSMQYNVIVLGQRLNAIYQKAPVQLEYANVNINATQKFKLPKDFSIEASGFYQSRSLSGVSVLRPMGSLDLGIRKNLPRNKGSLVLNGSNLLRSIVFRPVADLPEHNLYTRGYLRFFGRTVKLTYSRNFGNEKLKGKRSRVTGSEEERGRVQAQ